METTSSRQDTESLSNRGRSSYGNSCKKNASCYVVFNITKNLTIAKLGSVQKFRIRSMKKTITDPNAKFLYYLRSLKCKILTLDSATYKPRLISAASTDRN